MIERLSARPTTSTGPGEDRVGGLAAAILDGRRQVDDRAVRDIDGALRSRSTDPQLHAAALWLGHRQRAGLRLRRSHARGWVMGLHELLDRSLVDAATYAAPRLRATYPQIPYFEQIAFAVDRLPPLARGGRVPLIDDRDADVQVVRRPGANTVLIAFCGGKDQLGLPLCLVDRWMGQLDAHVIYLRDRKKAGYRTGIVTIGDMPDTIDALMTLVGDLDATRVVCLGNSSGGTGALRYARALGAERVVALAPITGGPDYVATIEPYLPPGRAMPWTDLVPLYRNNRIPVWIFYGADNEGDREQSTRMTGLPHVEVESLPDWEAHHLIAGLLRAGRLDEVLDWLVRADAPAPAPPMTSRPNPTRRLAPAGGTP